MTIYEVAFHLKKPLYELLSEMPYEELLGWLAYFDKRPIGWRDDDRAFKLLQAQGVKEKPGTVFKSLSVIYDQSKPYGPDRIDNSFKDSFMYQKLLSSISGEKIT